MKDFYTDYYAAMARSQAHAAFCEQVFGRNLCQHGFADMAALDALIRVTELGPHSRALDVGCGNGMIAEYLSDETGAHMTGMDFIPEAIRQAQARTAAKGERLAFFVGDINDMRLSPGAYDTILSIDTIYFSNDYARTIRELCAALCPGGQMAIFCAHGREPWVPRAQFPAATLAPDRTPLAQALVASGLAFRTYDFTQDDLRLAERRKEVLRALKDQFEAEGNMFIYENRMGDAEGISSAVQEGLHARYLYHVRI